MAQDGVVPLTSTSDGYFPKKEPSLGTEFETGRDNQKGGIGQEKVLLHNYGNRTTFVQTFC